MIPIKPPRNKNTKTLAIFDAQRPTLVPLRNSMRTAYSDYFKHAGSPLVISPIAMTDAQKAQLLGLYKTTYKEGVTDKYSLNWVYKLRNADKIAYCPMCGNVGYEAIEHYLPESYYPEFAFLTFNLIPTCTSCNSRRNKIANAPGTALPLIHPYFEGGKLQGAIVETKIKGLLRGGVISYAIPSFSLVPSIPITDPLFTRLDNHLTKCVSKSAFRRWIKNRWAIWREKSPTFASVDLLQKAVEDELKAEVKTGGHNNWTASFLRGLLSDPAILGWMHANP